MIAENIQKLIAEALKSRDEIRLSTLRLLASALNYERIAKLHELTLEEEIACVRKEARKRQDAIDAYEKVGARERADVERKELEILKEFLPSELSDADLGVVIDDAIAFTSAKDPGDFGKVITEVIRRVAGRADGKRIAEMITAKLQLKV